MQPVWYDGTFEGFLTAVFEIYEYKIAAPDISANDAVEGSIFSNVHIITANTDKAERVWKKLTQKISRTALDQFGNSFLSELPGMENTMFRYVQYVLKGAPGAENDYGHPDVLAIQQINKKVHREKHRMEAFVRFSLTGDGLYYSIVQPDFNVLPLIAPHFKNRYADQRWLIYDSRRKYGIHYDLERVAEVSLDFSETSDNTANIYDDKENLYQELWKQYFDSVNIAARKNTRLHIRHMPKRYWRYLVEKQQRSRRS